MIHTMSPRGNAGPCPLLLLLLLVSFMIGSNITIIGTVVIYCYRSCCCSLPHTPALQPPLPFRHWCGCHSCCCCWWYAVCFGCLPCCLPALLGSLLMLRVCGQLVVLKFVAVPPSLLLAAAAGALQRPLLCRSRGAAGTIQTAQVMQLQSKKQLGWVRVCACMCVRCMCVCPQHPADNTPVRTKCSVGLQIHRYMHGVCRRGSACRSASRCLQDHLQKRPIVGVRAAAAGDTPMRGYEHSSQS